jgi:hypothetical protein
MIILFFALISMSTAHASVAGLDWDKPVDASVLQDLQSESGLRVVWWNAHDGHTVSDTQDASFSNNIDQLVHSELAPDVIAFAEFQTSDLNSETLKEFEKIYPNHVMQGYPATPQYGITVYSKLPFEVSSVDLLDFTTLGPMSDADRDAYRSTWCQSMGMCARPLMILDLKMNGKIFKLVPTHLYDCWRLLIQKEGKFGAFQQIISGTDNPLWYH